MVNTGLTGLEYDLNTQLLYGIHWIGDTAVFTSVDLSTHTFTDLNYLGRNIGMTQGESTFDPIQEDIIIPLQLEFS
jgi:hypothetical protein